MTDTVLVTGASGFLGRHLCAHLSRLNPRPRIIGMDRCAEQSQGCISHVVADLADADTVAQTVREVRPQHVIHLAGSFGAQDAQEIYRANVLSATAVLEAVRQHASAAVTLLVGSAAEYGRIRTDQLPLTETTECEPISPYGMSKKIATEVALYYHRVHGLNVMVARPFQLIGKGVTSRLAPGAFATQLMQAKADGTESIKVGNLDSARDFLSVADAAKALWALCEKPSSGQVFNICSGEPLKIGELLQGMIAALGVNVRIETDPARLRGALDVPVVYGSHAKIQTHCGWTPTAALSETLGEMFE